MLGYNPLHSPDGSLVKSKSERILKFKNITGPVTDILCMEIQQKMLFNEDIKTFPFFNVLQLAELSENHRIS